MSAERGLSVESLETMFDEHGTPRTTGMSLVRQIDDPEVDRLWKATKREVDAFVADARRGP